jgi:hypothetical protein
MLKFPTNAPREEEERDDQAGQFVERELLVAFAVVGRHDAVVSVPIDPMDYAGKDGSFLARDAMQDAVVTGANDVGTSEGAGLGVELDERESLEGAGTEFEGVAVVDLPERESRQSTG